METKTTLLVSNILTRRCKQIIETTLDKLAIDSCVNEQGEIHAFRCLKIEEYQLLRQILFSYGLKLWDEEKSIMVLRIKSFLEEYVKTTNDQKLTLPQLLRHEFIYDYNYLSSLFSKITGMSLENYIIHCKIEYVKELILYENYNLTEISYKLDYSSVAHLSAQFKKTTGITPSRFKKMRIKTVVATPNQKRLYFLHNYIPV